MVILADDARLPIEGAAGGRGGGGGGGGASVRPEYADRLSPADLAAFEQFVRGGGTRRLPEQREHASPSSSSSCR